MQTVKIGSRRWGLAASLCVYPPLAARLFAYIAIVGIAAEALLMIWLVVIGVNTDQWREQAATSKTLSKSLVFSKSQDR